MRTMVVGLASLLACSCTAEAVSVRDPNGLFSFLATEAPGEVRQEGKKVLWLFADHRVATQSIRRSSYNRAMPLAEVAGALSERFELEDIEGEARPSPCTVDGRSVQCLDGWTRLGGERLQRRGFLFDGDDELVLVEVIGRGQRAEDLFGQLLESFRWHGGGRG